MTIRVDLLSRNQNAFGYVGRAILGIAETELIKSNIALFERGDSQFANVELENKISGVKTVFGLNEQGSLLSGAISPPPMVSFSRTKNIKRTVIDNSDYEVVESFGSQSWDIKMDCLVVDMENHWYNKSHIKEIRALFELNDTFIVTGDIFNDLGINEIYFTDIMDVGFVQGFNDTISFKLSARSIKPTEFFI